VKEAEKILSYLHNCPAAVEADVAGCLRRRKETVRRLCIVVASEEPKAVLDRFLRYPALARTDELEDSRCLVSLAVGIKAELIIVAPADYIDELHGRTGSREHIARLHELARAKAVNVSTHVPSKKSRSESEIYQRLGLPYIPPELREDEGEIEAALAGRLPDVVTR